MGNLDYCGIIILLRQLVRIGKYSDSEAAKIATRIAAETKVDIVFPL